MPASDPEWHALQGGLRVLELVDAWLTPDERIPAPIAEHVLAVIGALEAMPVTNAARAILTGIAIAIEHAGVPDVRLIAPRLMAYGRSLDYDAKWSLAADIYRTLAIHILPSADPALAIDANMRLGYCLRMLGDFTSAELAYAQAAQVAASAGDASRALQVRLGDAALAWMRGNLPLAEEILDATIAQSRTDPEYAAVRGLALHDRAVVAHSRGQYEHAIQFAYEALQHTQSLTGRDRLLGDIANAFQALGVYSTAREAYLILAATAQEQYVRWVVAVNLLEIAALEGSDPIFWQQSAKLEAERLPGPLEASYRFFLAKGLHTFGRIDEAAVALGQAGQLASAYKLNQLSFEIDNFRSEIARGEAQHLRPVRRTPVSVEYVATAISEMRELAGQPA